MNEFLNAEKIASLAKGDYHIEILQETDSTNRQLRDRAEQGAPEGSVLFALAQTAGRGRKGKSFYSPAGSGLYFSILLRPQSIDGIKITAAAGVAVAEAVGEVLGIDLAIKWVNDLYFRNKKVCGILAESVLSPDGGFDYCILGIGLNLFVPQGGFGDLDAIAGALLPQYRQGIAEPLAAAILDRFFDWYHRLEDASLMEQYRRRSFLQGKEVTVVRGAERIRGTVEGIDDEGALLLRVEDRLVAIQSGTLEDYR